MRSIHPNRSQTLASTHNPHLRYLDLNHHGYLTLSLNADEARADWYFAKTILKKNAKIKHSATRLLKSGETTMKKR